MKICKQCQQNYPDHAKYCSQCGKKLELIGEEQADKIERNKTTSSWKLFWLTLGGSLLLSWLLMAVFHLPVFILGVFLPLLWYSSKQ